jgi:erythromycin esterase
MGFTVLAMEANPASMAALNAYVLDGQGDLEQALAGLRFCNGTTRELRDLARWLRAYNADPARPRKVSVHGLDIRSSAVLHGDTLKFLEKADPPAGAWMAGSLAGLAWIPEGSPRPDQAQAKAWLEALGKLAARMDTRRARITARWGARTFLHHRQNLALLSRFVVILGGGIEGNQAREKAMAEHFQWILDREEPGAKAVIWAHNAHVSKALRKDWTGVRPMGRYLRTVLEDDYVAVGAAFRRGRFLALAEGREAGQVRTFDLPPEPKGTLDAALAATGYPMLALDLRQLPARGRTADWFGTPQGTWRVGVSFDPEDRDVNLQRIIPADHYDVLLFVERTGPLAQAVTGRTGSVTLNRLPLARAR